MKQKHPRNNLLLVEVALWAYLPLVQFHLHPTEDCVFCFLNLNIQLLKIHHNSDIRRKAGECGSCFGFIPRIFYHGCSFDIGWNVLEKMWCLQLIFLCKNLCQKVKVKSKRCKAKVKNSMHTCRDWLAMNHGIPQEGIDNQWCSIVQPGIIKIKKGGNTANFTEFTWSPHTTRPRYCSPIFLNWRYRSFTWPILHIAEDIWRPLVARLLCCCRHGCFHLSLPSAILDCQARYPMQTTHPDISQLYDEGNP